MNKTANISKKPVITDTKGNEILVGHEVEIIPNPQDGRVDPDEYCAYWQITDIFENTGQYPTLPNGPTVRLWKAFHDGWILPIAHIQMKVDES